MLLLAFGTRLRSTHCREFNYSFSELFEDSTLSSRELIVSALEQLAGDKDADVREAAAARLRVQPNPPIK